MTKKGTKTRLVRTEGPISDMDYHKIGTWPPGKPLPEIHPPWLKPQPPKPKSQPSPSYPPQE